MIYPKKLSSKKGDKILKILMMSSIILAILLIFINRITTPNIGWAAFINCGIVYVWITVIYSIKKSKNIAGHVLIQTIAMSIITLYIDYKLGFIGWAIYIAIPIIIIISNITMLILTIISYKKYIKYAVYQLIIVLFSMIPVILILENIIRLEILTIVATVISVINLIISLILSFRDFKEVIIRKFHM